MAVEPQQELETAVAMLADVMHHDVVGLWVLTEDGSAERRAFRGYDPAAPPSIPAAASGGPFGQALQEQRPARAPCATDDPAPPAWAAALATQYALQPVRPPGRPMAG